MNLKRALEWIFGRKEPPPEHIRRGILGEQSARRYLQRKGYTYLRANYRSPRGEIDLVFRDQDCLVFVEVKTRSSEEWGRPGEAVDAPKKRKLVATAEHYVRRLKQYYPKTRFDVVEVLLSDGAVREIRHLEDAFHADSYGSRLA